MKLKFILSLSLLLLSFSAPAAVIKKNCFGYNQSLRDHSFSLTIDGDTVTVENIRGSRLTRMTMLTYAKTEEFVDSSNRPSTIFKSVMGPSDFSVVIVNRLLTGERDEGVASIRSTDKVEFGATEFYCQN